MYLCDINSLTHTNYEIQYLNFYSKHYLLRINLQETPNVTHKEDWLLAVLAGKSSYNAIKPHPG